MALSHWGLVGPYDSIELAQLWFKLWLVAWHQAITWTDVDLSSNAFCGIHLRATSQEPPMSSIRKMCSNTTRLKLLSDFPGSNELKEFSQLVRSSHPNGWYDLENSRWRSWPWSYLMVVCECYRYVCFSFRDNWIIFGWNIANSIFELENWMLRSRQNQPKYNQLIYRLVSSILPKI